MTALGAIVKFVKRVSESESGKGRDNCIEEIQISGMVAVVDQG
jgi:hypothetical protein